ncbi:phosphate-starvation-inducible PsiE family protein [Propionivibrio limicola]|uniref:phosphate-starvation-inducible PsiE family protein n=1 Tax=Propionivibrio limicola TaxID=167645 RepID=UPI001291DE58|nr:phosphate-starvation-inducible PsiE family protein [Propionivibrio limicola]
MDEWQQLSKHDERFVRFLQSIIHLAVKALAVLMVVVIIFGVADVVYVLYTRISAHPYHLIDVSDILATFGAFIAVLIAIEIFINIVSYLRDDAIQLEVVIATAYMAILRKVIVLDYKETAPEYVFATAATVLALSIGYWLIVARKSRTRIVPGQRDRTAND